VTQESKWHLYDVFTHTDMALDHTEGFDLYEKLAVVLHDVGKAETKSFDEKHHAHFYGHPARSVKLAKQALTDLKYSKAEIDRVITLIAYHDYYVKPVKKILRRFLAHIDMDYDTAFAILRVQCADDHAKNQELAREKIQNIHDCTALLQTMQKEDPPLKRSDLQINGYDLMALGYEGKQIGSTLEQLYLNVIDDPSLNTKETLLQLLQKK